MTPSEERVEIIDHDYLDMAGRLERGEGLDEDDFLHFFYCTVEAVVLLDVRAMTAAQGAAKALREALSAHPYADEDRGRLWAVEMVCVMARFVILDDAP